MGKNADLACTVSSGGYEPPNAPQSMKYLFEQLMGVRWVLQEDLGACSYGLIAYLRPSQQAVYNFVDMFISSTSPRAFNERTIIWKGIRS
jgi:hypothetical protein